MSDLKLSSFSPSPKQPLEASSVTGRTEDGRPVTLQPGHADARKEFIQSNSSTASEALSTSLKKENSKKLSKFFVTKSRTSQKDALQTKNKPLEPERSASHPTIFKKSGKLDDEPDRSASHASYFMKILSGLGPSHSAGKLASSRSVDRENKQAQVIELGVGVAGKILEAAREEGPLLEGFATEFIKQTESQFRSVRGWKLDDRFLRALQDEDLEHPQVDELYDRIEAALAQTKLILDLVDDPVSYAHRKEQQQLAVSYARYVGQRAGLTYGEEEQLRKEVLTLLKMHGTDGMDFEKTSDKSNLTLAQHQYAILHDLVSTAWLNAFGAPLTIEPQPPQ
ncbi:hypothetical protein [Methylocystis echinoides]|uniref:Uncharacterized protein n=1 Tax=Methylocystis echinoides TaxID=29468 RepID=A0A9W6GX02_9HYPH|nr:hypothetical protein [Methylocystis echinoides]GLI94661.1 hypothetical protein LMG27198_36530 [Methylocystis echinoides]